MQRFFCVLQDALRFSVGIGIGENQGVPTFPFRNGSLIVNAQRQITGGRKIAAPQAVLAFRQSGGAGGYEAFRHIQGNMEICAFTDERVSDGKIRIRPPLSVFING